MSKWDGTIAYAFSKRAQIELTNYWAKKYPNIGFYSMHPGWSDTPGVEKSLPGFHKMLGSSLRPVEMGADTIVWASVIPKLRDLVPNGSFLFDRKVAPQHLPFGNTETDPGAAEKLVANMNRYI